MRANGRFRKMGSHRVYSGGWVRYLDYCEGSRLTMIWLMYALRQMGMIGIFLLFYKNAMHSLDDGLVQLKTQGDVDDMIRWAKGFREIGMFVTHPSRSLLRACF
ncbi:hypothetical protein LIER_20468 [Lithospermum erythrorhizon]|uniref:Uncharacterized protein n=1 Tax=Lithospermum erythrorhizon TaxID=34254 RepID=A0AAV3QMM8_LITER